MQLKPQNEMYIPGQTSDLINKRGIIYSVVAHVVVIGGFIIQANFLSKPVTVDFQSAIRVDVLGLPEKYKPEDFVKPAEPAKESPPVKVAEPEAKKETPAPEKVKELPKEKVAKPDMDAVSLKKNKKKQEDAFKKLKAQEALDKIKNALANEKKPAPKQIKGNAIAPGTDLTGLDRLVHQNYGNELNRHVKQFWAIPEWLRGKPYRTLIKVKINERGQIISKEIVRGSGNEDFDENAMGTVEQAAPFPAPPEKLVDLVRIDGILLGFPE